MLAPHLFLSKFRIFSAVNRRSALLSVVGLLLLGLWAMIFVFASFQKTRLIDENTRELALLNNAVAQHAATLFKTADTDLRVIDRWLQAQPRTDPRTDANFVALVDELRSASDGLLDLHLIDAEGRLFSVPTRDGDGKPASDVSKQAYFRVQMDLVPNGGERSLHIGGPVLNESSGRWSIPLSRRLEVPVAGITVVLANIDLDRLISLHDGMRIQPRGSIMLVRLDGLSMSRAPYVPAMIGRDIKSMPEFRNEVAVKASGSFVTDGTRGDRLARLSSFERLTKYPVAVLVSRGLEDILSTFYSRLKIVLLIAVLVTLTVLGFTFMLYRSMGSLQTANNMLQHLATTDALTGVMSRRAFFDLAQREFARARRNGRPAAVLALDMDHFKQVNDTHGHALGDKVLHDSAAQLQVGLREHDLLGRIGGEEFVIVLPETSREAALMAAERLRRAVAALSFQGAGGKFRMTVSIGMAMICHGDETLAQTLARADAALLRAKREGRDRIEIALDVPAQPPVQPVLDRVDA